MKTTTVAVLGGDVRMDYAACTLRKLGYTVLEWGRAGVGEDANAALFAILQEADVWMLPLPATEDGVHLTLRVKGFEPIRLETLLRMASGKRIFGGKLPPAFCESAEREGISVCDYFESESLQYRNALPIHRDKLHYPLILTFYLRQLKPKDDPKLVLEAEGLKP